MGLQPLTRGSSPWRVAQAGSTGWWRPGWPWNALEARERVHVCVSAHSKRARSSIAPYGCTVGCAGARGLAWKRWGAPERSCWKPGGTRNPRCQSVERSGTQGGPGCQPRDPRLPPPLLTTLPPPGSGSGLFSSILLSSWLWQVSGELGWVQGAGSKTHKTHVGIVETGRGTEAAAPPGPAAGGTVSQPGRLWALPSLPGPASAVPHKM